MNTIATERSQRQQADAAIEAAAELADQLCEGALWHGELCAFHGASPAATLEQPAYWRVFGADYYEGSAGIARALAYFAHAHPHSSARATALGAMRHALLHADGWSLHSGGLGVALVALEMAELLDAPQLSAPALQLAQTALESAAADAQQGSAPMDFMAGLAGGLYGALELAAQLPAAAQHAQKLALILREQAKPQSQGHSWALHPPAAANSLHLCGLAHGAAGVALALQRQAPAALAQRADEGNALMADSGRRFERLHFSSAACSWADLRSVSGLPESSGERSYPHYWCHGSVGIAHERLAAVRVLAGSDPAYAPAAADLAAALHGVRREARRLLAGAVGAGAGFEINASQCHGLSGMIDLLVETHNPDDRELAGRLAQHAREDARRPQGWRCGNPGGEPCPGLMTGWAGILWGQLRAAAPESLPVAYAPRLSRLRGGAIEAQGRSEAA